MIKLSRKNNRSYGQLVANIYSLNIKGIRLPSLIVKDHVSKNLPNITTNPEIKEVLKMPTYNYGDLFSYFSSITPFYAPILHEMVRNSNAGIIKSFVNRFSKVSTLFKITQRDSPSDIFLAVTDIDNLICRRLNFRLGVNNREFIARTSRCPYIISTLMRNESWGINVIGVTHTLPYHQGEIRVFCLVFSDFTLLFPDIYISLSLVHFLFITGLSHL